MRLDSKISSLCLTNQLILWLGKSSISLIFLHGPDTDVDHHISITHVRPLDSPWLHLHVRSTLATTLALHTSTA